MEYDEWVITEAFYNMGRTTTNKKRFVRAPFVLATMQESATERFQTYWMPTHGGAGLTSRDNELGETGWGYVTLQNMVMGANDMGDFDGHPDDWTGLHAIGFI